MRVVGIAFGVWLVSVNVAVAVSLAVFEVEKTCKDTHAGYFGAGTGPVSGQTCETRIVRR
jgi:hypothetical protein